MQMWWIIIIFHGDSDKTDVSDLKSDVTILRQGVKSPKSDRIQVRDWRYIREIIRAMGIGFRQDVAGLGI